MARHIHLSSSSYIGWYGTTQGEHFQMTYNPSIGTNASTLEVTKAGVYQFVASFSVSVVGFSGILDVITRVIINNQPQPETITVRDFTPEDSWMLRYDTFIRSRCKRPSRN